MDKYKDLLTMREHWKNWREDNLLTSQEMHSDKPFGFRLCSLWSLRATCCSASASLCTAQSTWFQVFSWAPAELAFHIAEGQSITVFPCPMTHVPDGAIRLLSGLPVNQIWLLASRRKKTGVDVGCWHVIDTILWSEWKISLLVTNKRGGLI